MAKIQTSPLVTDIRQRIGGVVFQGTLGGTMARVAKAKAATPATTAQTTKANYLTALKYWQVTLTPTQRSDWATFASSHPSFDVFGNPVIVSGFDAFMKWTIPLLSGGNAISATPPASVSVTQPTSFTVSADSSGPTIELTAISPAPVNTEQLVIGSQGYSYPWRASGLIRRAALVYPNAPLTLPYDFTVAFLKKYGMIQSGRAIPITIFVLSSLTGTKSTTLGITIVAT